MTRGALRPRLHGIAKFRSSPKQQITTRTRPSFDLHSGRLWSRRTQMWWRLMAGIISDRSLPRVVVCAAGYPSSSCLRALAKMNLAAGGRKASSAESSVCTLPHSSAASVTSSIWLNLACRGNESLPDTMWLIMTISRGAPQKFENSEIRNSKKVCPAGELLSCLSAIRREEEPSKVNPSLRRISTAIIRLRQGYGGQGNREVRHQSSAFAVGSRAVLGDGPLRETLNSQLSTLNLNSTCICQASSRTTNCRFTTHWRMHSCMPARLSNGGWL